MSGVRAFESLSPGDTRDTWEAQNATRCPMMLLNAIDTLGNEPFLS